MSRRTALVTAGAAGLALTGCSGSPDTKITSPHTGLADQLSSPFYIAHRGGAARYPEHSMRAYDADAESGFPIEMDVQLLKDGTPVIIHDDTVDRTMTGHGKVQDLTLKQWRNMRIKPINPGGKPAKPLVLSEVLDKFGGKNLLVPEVKSKDARDPLLEAIVDRGLQRDVIVQSFYYEAAVAAAAKNMPAMWLIASRQSAERLSAAASDGIVYLGYDSDLSAEVVKKALKADLEPVAWTVDTASMARRQFKSGAVGVFTDDPWKLIHDK